MPLNVELLLKAKEAILAHPQQAYMGQWAVCDDWSTDHTGTLLEYSPLSCKTDCCIAGWIVAVAPEPLPKNKSISQVACDLLDCEGIDALFYAMRWPVSISRKYYMSCNNMSDTKYHEARANAMAEAIDWAIEKFGDKSADDHSQKLKTSP